MSTTARTTAKTNPTTAGTNTSPRYLSGKIPIGKSYNETKMYDATLSPIATAILDSQSNFTVFSLIFTYGIL